MTLDNLLRAAGLPWLEARMLAERALGMSAVTVAANLRTAISPADAEKFEALTARRRNGEPVAYILGEREFYGRSFIVTPDVLIPRPETELLCEAVLERLSAAKAGEGAAILDLGTGSGAIAVTLACERPDISVTAVDVSSATLAVARVNAARFNVTGRIHFVQSDWFSELGGARFDIIVSNPPYVTEGDTHLATGDLRFEPRLALLGGAYGMTALRQIARNAPAYLDPRGWLLFEHGWTQGDECRKALSTNGFDDIITIRDLNRHDRVTLGQLRAK